MLLWLLIIISAYFIHLFHKQKYSIWSKQGVKGPAPIPILGNFTNIVFQIEPFSEYIKKIYEQYPDEDIVGLYRGYQPMVVLKDPEIIKKVLIKDFHLFKNRGLTPSRGRINENLIVAEDDTWKILRQNLTPVFTSKKIKDMFLPLQKCSDNFINHLEQMLNTKTEIEIKQIMEKYAMQATTCCAFGVDIDPLNNKENEFVTTTKMMLTASFMTKLTLTLDVFFPGIRKYFYTNLKAEQAFTNLVGQIIEQKTKQPHMANNDFLDLIVHLRQRGKLNRRGNEGMSEIVLDNDLMIAQVAVFYIAGIEPTSWLISFILHELSLNQAIQDRLYEEICEVTKKYDQLSFRAMEEMFYLDMVVKETLRRNPIAHTIFRISDGDYIIPERGIVIPKNTAIIVSVSAIQNDPKYFPNPEIFDPENFSAQNRKNIPQCVDLAFGDGPRNCIGMRFAIIMTKVAIAAFIKKFKVSTCRKTKLEFDLDKFSTILSPKDGMWMHVAKRQTIEIATV